MKKNFSEGVQLGLKQKHLDIQTIYTSIFQSDKRSLQVRDANNSVVLPDFKLFQVIWKK